MGSPCCESPRTQSTTEGEASALLRSCTSCSWLPGSVQPRSQGMPCRLPGSRNTRDGITRLADVLVLRRGSPCYIFHRSI